ncbi:MAG: metalloregulator ArsR/SmtB family transcription factor [Actinomycetia bacterium]|nr:metalloregulator ArsR/SmtB family transcription factor [Actinomycetes bacterium]
MSKSPDQECDQAAPPSGQPLTRAAAEEIVPKLKALADPVRLRLFSAVASRSGGEACVCDVSEGLEVSQPTISHHLKVLREAGLLTAQRRGSWVYYAVVPDALSALTDRLIGVQV